ncbi:hypothetical protein HPP92_014587 [Vanilla planifolia]|uniref:Uncharacterized protein n=1 Tax=Vanilla planifolia TaxID=51239 RepID=A0A835QPR9_VANPL|nr:hypothetical protein HPP92_014587 [Vanilla planifolia]
MTLVCLIQCFEDREEKTMDAEMPSVKYEPTEEKEIGSTCFGMSQPASFVGSSEPKIDERPDVCIANISSGATSKTHSIINVGDPNNDDPLLALKKKDKEVESQTSEITNWWLGGGGVYYGARD